jgi:isoleucyl-tRNA synthetase
MAYVIALTASREALLLSADRIAGLKEVLGELSIIAEISGEFQGEVILMSGANLIGTRYTHTFHPISSASQRPQIFHSAHVTSQSGTGLVHSAPAHGQEDYHAFAKAGLLPSELRSPIDDDGRFTASVDEWSDGQAAALIGKEVLGEGITLMVQLLRRSGALLAEQAITHRYPYDWKSKKPIIIR